MSTEESRPSGRHQVNIGHLVMGIAFLGIVGVWALVQSDTVTGDDIRWLMPVPWVLAGVAGLAATAITGSRRYAVRQTGWVGQQADVIHQHDQHDLQDRQDQQDQQDHDVQNDSEETP